MSEFYNWAIYLAFIFGSIIDQWTRIYQKIVDHNNQILQQNLNFVVDRKTSEKTQSILLLILKSNSLFYALKIPHYNNFWLYSHCLFCSWFPSFSSPPAPSNSDPLWSPGIVLTFAWQNIKQQICSIWVVSCNVILSNWQFPKGFRKEHTIPQTPGGLTVTAKTVHAFSGP